MGRLIREESGAETFLAVAELHAGDEFKRRIRSEIRSARELVALFTPSSALRPWVWIEVGAAWLQDKRVIAVLHGLSITEFDEITKGKGLFDDLNVIQPNDDFDRYLAELSIRVTEEGNA